MPVSYTHLDVYKRQEQEVLQSKIMGSGNFETNGSNVTMYVIKLYNEAKHLEPPLPFWSFVRHISKHLPPEIQITLMTREVTEITELEKILDIFQNIRAVSYTHLTTWKAVEAYCAIHSLCVCVCNVIFLLFYFLLLYMLHRIYLYHQRLLNSPPQIVHVLCFCHITLHIYYIHFS